MSGLGYATRVVRSDTGAQVALAEVADGCVAVSVWALDGDLRIVPATIASLTCRTARVHELRLASGRTAAVADDHQVLTREGWMPVDALQIGTRVAVPRAVPDPVQPVWWPDDEVILLAHLLTDPAGRRRPLCYTTGDEANADAVEKAAAHFGVSPRRVCHGDFWRLYLPAPANLPKGDRHPVLGWLDRLGVARDPDEAHLPSAVFALDRRQLALFVRHLWAAGGVLRVGDGGQAVLSYAATSRVMADDLQAALARFGVATRVRRARGPDSAWHVLVLGAEAQYRFVDEIGAYSGGGAVAQRVARFLAATGDARLERRATTDIGWDVVTSVQQAGEQPVCRARLVGPDEPALLAGGIAVAG
ncbi:MAG: LAGLIDADG family homing endonuclease [Actinomycetota bacterium]